MPPVANQPPPPQHHAKGERPALDRQWLTYLSAGGDPGDGQAIASDPSFQAGIATFNEHRFFEAHELFEQAWLRALYPDRLIGHSLAKLCAALVWAERREVQSTAKAMRNATRILAGLPGTYARIDLASLLLEFTESWTPEATNSAKLKIVVKQ